MSEASSDHSRQRRGPPTGPQDHGPFSGRQDHGPLSGRQDHGPLSGRQAEAARNDRRILSSARAVFVEDPGAPITAVAKYAGVGISALYTRYASKEDLLRTLCTDALVRLAPAERAAVLTGGFRIAVRTAGA